MVLTKKQKQELDRALLDYFKSSGYNNTYKSFLEESGCEAEREEDAGSLEKKWTTIIRLQKQVIELEEKLKSLGSNPSLTQSKSRSNISKEALPRAPHTYSLSGHRKAVNSVAIHPFCSTAASGSADSTVQIWDYETGEHSQTLRGHTNSVEAVAFSSSGELLGSGSADMFAKLWTLKDEAYTCTKTLRGHEETVSGIVFSPLSDLVYTCSRDKTIKMWDVETGFCKKTFTGHTDWVRSIDVNSDGSRLVSASTDQSIRIWDTKTGQSLSVINDHVHVVECVRFAPPSYRLKGELETTPAEYIGSASRDSTVRVFNALTGVEVSVFNGHENWTRAVVFHPNRPVLISCSDDKSIRVWDLQNECCIRTISDAHSQFISSIALTNNCSAFISCSVDTTLRIWPCK
eukprot:c18525_g1_i1.p1 GENE.c18525_g1_i1~~c18525_g1_i1.p1  ORF type:complete len:403 (+),score=158.68 c18525_g1_i1:23-1231(+)